MMAYVLAMMTLHVHAAALLTHGHGGRRVLHAGIGTGSRSDLGILRICTADREKRAETRRSQANHQFLHSAVLRVELNLQRGKNVRESRTLHQERESRGSGAKTAQAVRRIRARVNRPSGAIARRSMRCARSRVAI